MKIARLIIVAFVATIVALSVEGADYWDFIPTIKNGTTNWVPTRHSGVAKKAFQFNVPADGKRLSRQQEERTAPEPHSLPIGTLSRLQEALAKEGRDMSISLFQVNEDDTQNPLGYGESHNLKFTSYQEMVSFLRRRVIDMAPGFMVSNYRADRSVWLAILVVDRLSATFFSFTEFPIGTREYPSGFVDNYEPRLTSYPTFNLGGTVQRAKIIALSGDDTITDWDTKFRPERGGDVGVEDGNLVIHSDFCTEIASGLDMVFQVWYLDGTTEAFDAQGDLTTLPTPHLLLRPVDDGMEVVVKYAPVGHRDFTIEKTSSLSTPPVEWKKFTVNDNVQVLLDLSSTNKSAFYRIAD